MNSPVMQTVLLAQIARALGFYDELIRSIEAEKEQRRLIERLQLEAEVGWESDVLDVLRVYSNLT
jgi:hypothetical protein